MIPAENPSGEAGYPDSLHHEPVMLQEVLDLLDPQPGETLVDCTLGGGGHALELCRRVGPTGRVIGIEQDADALARARHRLQDCPVTFVHDNFKHLENILTTFAADGVDGFLFDLGVSSFQLEAAARGFSFRAEAPLDMRMDPRTSTTAAALVNRMSEEEMVRLFFAAGYGRWARRLTRAVITSRQQSPIITTTQFADLIAATLPATHRSKIHPATQAFLALRIAVNDEIAVLEEALTIAAEHCNSHARIVVLSYHSLEDGVTKWKFRFLAGKRPPPSIPFAMEPPAPAPRFQILTKKPLTPTPDEIRRNPRSRSAKLRAVERLSGEADSP